MTEEEMTREEVVKYNLELRKQLQSYKSKEDKLRELFEKKPRYDKEKHQHILRVGTIEEVLQILNDKVVE